MGKAVEVKDPLVRLMREGRSLQVFKLAGLEVVKVHDFEQVENFPWDLMRLV